MIQSKPSEKGEIITYLSRMGDVLEQILERHEVVVLAAVGVHIVIDSDVADAEHGEAFLDVQARVELISTEATEIFGHNDPDPAVFHV